MVANAKPGVDWPQVKQWIEDGVGYRECARRCTEAGAKISHVAVSKRARKEGWVAVARPDPVNLVTQHMIELAEPKTVKEINLASAGKRTPENLRIILERLRDQGRSQTTAIAGIMSWNAWKRWLADDVEVAEMVEAAILDNLGDAETEIDKAGKRGDWKAAQTKLLSNPRTKPEWQGSQQAQSGGGITVVLNVPRAEKVIDHEG